jgi:hypothetical protein
MTSIGAVGYLRQGAPESAYPTIPHISPRARKVSPSSQEIHTAISIFLRKLESREGLPLRSSQARTPEGLKVATLRAGLRRALKGNEELKLAQRGEETFLMTKTPE